MNKITFFICIILMLFYSVLSFGQTYSGPSTGSVASGVIVSTENFADQPGGNEITGEPRVINNEEPILGEMIYGGTGQTFSNYVYSEDNPVSSRGTDDIGLSFELQSFSSIPETNSFPPDNHMAVGPNHVISMVNSVFYIYDRDGNYIKGISADAWTSPVLPNPSAFDPQIIYDHFAGRWFMLWDNQTDATQTAYFLISYSDDDDPIGTWYSYALDATKNGTGGTTTWGDYPQIGYDDQAIYINSRQFLFNGGGYLYNKIRILNKSELYAANAGPLTWTDLWNIRRPNGSDALDVIHPAISYDAGLNAGYFMWAGGSFSTFYAFYKITNPITNPVLTGVELAVPTYYDPPLANQLGGGTRIESGGSKIRNAPIIRDGKIYTAHAIRNSQFTQYSSLKYFVVDINTNAVLEQVEQGAQGYFYFYPAIAVDKNNNLAITYSRSADSEYVGSYYSTKLGTDPPGLSPNKVMIEGQGNYVKVGSGRNRWGDYLSAVVDPVDQYNIWLYSEYAAATNTWGTWLTEIRMVPFSGAYAFASPEVTDFGDIEVGTVSDYKTVVLANYGDQELQITNIPAAIGDFNLVTSLTFPIALQSYDSLQIQFSFTPTVIGEATVQYTVNSNDPNFSSLTLNGKGYKIHPALDKTIYASSGSQNNGEILTIDKITGAGTSVGPSLFSEVKDITIHPVTGIIYGLIAYNSSSDIVRVSAAGDAYFLLSINIGNMSGIAFNNSGVLFAVTRTGEIYTIDLVNGTTTPVVTGVGSYLNIAFHPTTNEMWATSRSFIPPNKDAIFKVNLTTGDTTIVGHTGLGKQTNDIVFDDLFDETGILYGVIGLESEINDFISIDISNGSGTVLGSTGMKNILGLAFEETGVSSIEEERPITPAGFSLSQNYPNPFNPETSIEFNLPINSNVTITVYNLLGQIVRTLVDNDFSSGYHSAIWNGIDETGKGVSSGIYFYKMKANGMNGQEYSNIKKMILLK